MTTAFLNEELKEVYVYDQKKPEGCIVKGKEGHIYGLKQSPKCWNSALDI